MPSSVATVASVAGYSLTKEAYAPDYGPENRAMRPFRTINSPQIHSLKRYCMVRPKFLA